MPILCNWLESFFSKTHTSRNTDNSSIIWKYDFSFLAAASAQYRQLLKLYLIVNLCTCISPSSLRQWELLLRASDGKCNLPATNQSKPGTLLKPPHVIHWLRPTVKISNGVPVCIFVSRVENFALATASGAIPTAFSRWSVSFHPISRQRAISVTSSSTSDTRNAWLRLLH